MKQERIYFYGFEDKIVEKSIKNNANSLIRSTGKLIQLRNWWWDKNNTRPDWNSKDLKYIINVESGNIITRKVNTTWKEDYYMLAFTTEDSRDAFLNNYEHDIKSADESILRTEQHYN